MRISDENALNCWNELKVLIATTELETINVNAAKAEKISKIRHAEIKAIEILC